MKRLLFTLLLTFCFTTGFTQTNIIDDELLEVLNRDGNEMIDVNIILKSQLSLSTLRNKVDDIEDKIQKRNVVVDEFKSFAEQSQSDIMSIIKSEEMRGNAGKIRSHWLSNSISCTISKDLIYLLSTHDDVALIGYNTKKYALWEEESQAVEATREATDNISQINADDVWEMGYTGKGVLVAILDSGVNYNHPDIADHLWDGGTKYPKHGYDFCYNDVDPMDVTGHGTHCAGIICGDGTSGRKTGVAPDATLMCVRVIDDNGHTDADHIISGIEFAVENGADIMSMSLGLKQTVASNTDKEMLRTACVNVLEAGVVASVAVGNDGSDYYSPVPNNVRVPGSCPPPWIHPDQKANEGGRSCVIAVGAVNEDDEVTYFSSQGPVTWKGTSYSDYPYNPGIGLIRPDICAPGWNIVSLDNSNDGSYIMMSGTSQAAPCVAGVMCLMLSKNKDLTPEKISEILETTCVKLSDTKSNTTGSGRVDALAAVNAIDMGAIMLQDFSINDIEGNNNSHLNFGENVTLNLNLKNKSSQSFDNVTAVLKCENNLVNITKSNVDIGHIEADASFSLNDVFAFSLSSESKDLKNILLDIEFYSDDTKITTNRIMVEIYYNVLQFAELSVRNDSNGNGILEAGETAELGVALNNIGNEISLTVNGILSHNGSLVTINNNEASFGPIGTDASAIAYFNITVSNSYLAGSDIPFELEAKDILGNTNNFDISYIGECGIIYDLYDTFGDGWSGAKITAVYSDGSTSDTYTITSGSYARFTKDLSSGIEVILEWKKGSLDTECSYTVSYDNGTVIYSGSGTNPKGEFFRWTNNCSCQNALIQSCEGVKNLNIRTGNNMVYLSWESPATDVVEYEIYRDTKLLGTTAELSFTDDGLHANGKYYYNVRPVYENCNGSLAGEEIDFFLGNIENKEINAAVYPNPSNDRFVVKCENMTNIMVFNIMGEVVMNIDTNDNYYEINGLKSGIYFINVKSENGNVVRKVVKY